METIYTHYKHTDATNTTDFVGVTKTGEKSFTAVTLSKSRDFKTAKGAIKWVKKVMGEE